MKVRDGYNNTTTKVVAFNMQDRLDNKIDKLTPMMSKLTAQGNKQDKQFKPKIYQGKKRAQTKHNYDQANQHNRNRSISGDRRTALRGRGRYIQNYGQNYRGRPQYADKMYEMTLGEEILVRFKTIEVRISEVDIEMVTEMFTETVIEMTKEMTILEEVGVGLVLYKVLLKQI